MVIKKQIPLSAPCFVFPFLLSHEPALRALPPAVAGGSFDSGAKKTNTAFSGACFFVCTTISYRVFSGVRVDELHLVQSVSMVQEQMISYASQDVEL